MSEHGHFVLAGPRENTRRALDMRSLTIGGFMNVTRCDLPSATAVDPELIRHAFFIDSHRISLARADMPVTDIFFAAFGHHPAWLKAILLARHRLGGLFGLRAAHPSQILDPTQAASYRLGENIGPWPLHFLGARELVAGVNDKHLDFRVSVLKQKKGEAEIAVVSTVCRAHNGFGRMYLRVISPFHTWGVRRLLIQAVKAGRL